ncbi:hypothetical protein AVEN_213352-1 [Araneus ventricosus]|uniref:Uncharacterized protein n=1 Tax=Araneus ventricosus TaxID=182803 RepID=A0A4Y2JC53_ARAVE|nr:hypothetical protein AVEN_213352-1 [Araneus ventricosus]
MVSLLTAYPAISAGWKLIQKSGETSKINNSEGRKMLFARKEGKEAGRKEHVSVIPKEIIAKCCEHCAFSYDSYVPEWKTTNRTFCEDQEKVVFDRLAVLISGVPGFKEGKPLSVPTVLDGTAQSQANKVFEIVEDWGLSKNIYALCFDTTASNIGWKNGACVQLENHLKRKLLFLACRYHIFELLESAVWKSVFGTSMSPDHTKFKQFQEKMAHT